MNRIYYLLDVFKDFKINQYYGWTPFALEMKKRFEDEGLQLYKHRIHTGIDLRMMIGTPIECPLTGIVLVDDDINDSGRGIATSIWDPNQLLAFRAYHFRENIVYEKQKIKAGNIVAYSGKSAGKLTIGNKPHLHYELVTTDKYGRAIGKYGGAIDPHGKNIIWY